MIAMKPSHKFFEVFVDNDLNSLFDYLLVKQDELLSGSLVSIPEDVLSKYNKDNGPTTQLGGYYNVFNLEHDGIAELKQSLSNLMKDASDYYGLDYESLDFMIHGWYNLDYKTYASWDDKKQKMMAMNGGVSPINNAHSFHDHAEGTGSPIFHGYYCVNAEPSITYYKINREILFENHNKNNRAIISETGHPHGRDDWYEDKPRITIAYDIAPKESHVVTDLWVKL